MGCELWSNLQADDTVQWVAFVKKHSPPLVFCGVQIHHEIFTILLYDFQSDGKDGLIKIQLPQGHHPLEAAINILVSLARSSVLVVGRDRLGALPPLLQLISGYQPIKEAFWGVSPSLLLKILSEFCNPKRSCFFGGCRPSKTFFCVCVLNFLFFLPKMAHGWCVVWGRSMNLLEKRERND